VFLQSGYRVLWCIRASRYRVVKKLVNYPGAVKFITSSGAVRVCPDVISWFESRIKSKNRDKLFNYTVRVSVVVPVSGLQMLLKAQSFLKSVAIWVQELLNLILSRFTDCLVFWICLATQMGFKVLILCFVPHRALPLTARQYGEVVLPDASTGQRPDSLAR
jgi:hypothetical protein